MRTSKKILSFFLAVVMVVTTCSVGFTAFAADKQTSLWSTKCEADDAFATLDGLADLLPSLLIGIPQLGDPIYAKYAKEYGKEASQLTDAEKKEIAGKATLQDVLGVLQPTLIQALAGVSQGAFVSDILNDTSDPSNYNYLNRESTVSYYTLYSICKKYMNNNDISKSTRDTLKEWYEKLAPLAGLYQKLAEQQAQAEAKVGEIAERFNNDESTYNSAVLQQLKDFDAAGGFAVTDEEQLLVDSYIATANNSLRALGTSIVITDLPELIYYIFGAGNICINADYYCNLINLGGGSINFKQTADLLGIGVDIDYDLKGLTAENYADKLIDATFPACGMTLEEFAANIGFSAELTRSMCENAFATALVDVIIKDGAKTVEQSKYYTYMLKGLAVEYIDDITDPSQIDEAVMSTMPTGWKTSKCVLTDAEIADMASVFNSLRNSKNKAAISEYFLNGSANIYQASDPYNTVNATLPSVLKGTVPAEYFNMVMLETASEVTDHRLGLTKAFTGEAAFNTPTYEKDSENNFILNDQGHVILKGRASQIGNPNGLDDNGDVQPMTINGYIAEAETYAYAKYVANLLGITDFEADSYKLKTILNIDNAIGLQAEKILAEGGATSGVVLTDEQKAILNADYDLTGAVGTEILNDILNGTVVSLIQMELLGTTVNGLINSLLITPIDLTAALEDVWSRVYNKPVATIFELLPVLVVLIDELAEPLLLNNCKDDTWSNILYNAFSGGKIANYYLDNGSHIGITQIGWDLNELLPDLMHWLLEGSKATGINYYKGQTLPLKEFVDYGDSFAFELVNFNPSTVDEAALADKLLGLSGDLANHYVITDADGKQITRTVDETTGLITLSYNGKSVSYNPYTDGGKENYKSDIIKPLFEQLFANPNAGQSDDEGKYINKNFTFSFTYEGNVPRLTGIYIADKALRDAKLSDLNKLLAKALDYETVKDAAGNAVKNAKGEEIKQLKKDDKGQPIASPSNTANALSEVITEIATLFTAAIDEFISNDALVNNTKYDNSGQTLNNGLNNIFVAIPQLFDIMEDLGAEKYGIDKNAWTYCFDGKIQSAQYTSYVDEYETSKNEKVKDNYVCKKSADGTESWSTVIGGKTSSIDKADIPEYVFKGPGTVYVDNAPHGIAIKTFTMNENTSLEGFKAFAMSSDPDRSVDILDCFAGIFVEEWLNSIVSLVNNVVITDNKITSNLPIIAGLLRSLDGFGEKSILTDVFNGIFQLKRGDEYSFDFAKDQRTGFTGLDRDNAYFLITNIETLVKVIKGTIEAAKKNNSSNNTNNNNNTTSSSPVVVQPVKNANIDVSKYSAQQLEKGDETLDKLDSMLGGILNGSSINGYKLNSAGNLASGLVSLLSNVISPDNSKAVVTLLDSYLYYLDGAGTKTPDANGNMKPQEVYTNENLTSLVVRTYALIENIMADLLKKFNYQYGTAELPLQYNILTEAIGGVISPDAIAVRLTDASYKDAQEKIAKADCWNDLINQGNISVSINWNITNGDNNAFFKGLASSLRLVTSIVGVLLIDTGWYQSVVMPVLNALCKNVGIKIDTATEYADASNPYRDEALLGLIRPLVGWLNAFLNKPVNTLFSTIRSLAALLDDTNTADGTIASIVSNAIAPIANELNGAANILNISSSKLKALSPTLAAVLQGLVNEKIAKLAAVENQTLVNIKIKDVPLSGSNLIQIINTLLAKLGFSLKQIDWKLISKTKSNAAILLYIVEYVLDVVLSNGDAIKKLLGDKYTGALKDVLDMVFTLTAADVVSIILRLLEVTQSPTEVYWHYENYKSKIISFIFPKGITKYDADKAVAQLDDAVAGVFALLNGLDVIKFDDLAGLLNGALYKNEIVTKLAVTLYGALDTEKLSPYLEMVGIPVSTKEVAKLLTDKSYGATYSSAAKKIASVSSWSKVKNVNWGFTDGAANAQQGFINALVAVLRPVLDILAPFLNGSNLELGDILYNIIIGLDIATGDKSKGEALVTLKNGKLDIQIATNGVYNSEISIDLSALEMLKDLSLYGSNGYENAIIPLLDVLQVDDKEIKTYAQYVSDCKKAKDNILLDVLNPLMSFVDKVVEKPFDTITSVLPNLAYFIDNNGIGQLLDNLLSPLTQILKDAKKNGVDIDKIIKLVIGKDLGKFVADALGVKTKLNIKLTDLYSCNIQEVVVPLINSLLKSNKINIKLPNFEWSTIAAHGDVVTSKSSAENSKGKFTNKEVIADKGETLVAVLRYLAETIIRNTSSLKSLLCSIDAIKKNSTISSVIKSVFNTISTAKSDQIVLAIFYFLQGEPTNAFWNYTEYKTGEYDFSYPEGMDVDFLKNLPPMLDGLIGGLADLNGLIAENLFKDELISKLAVGLYGAIEGVKINDNTNLAELLALTNIDFTTENVAKLLVDEKYGQTFEGASSVIKSAGSWAKVNASSLKWGVKDRDSFFHALVAVLRPIYGVLDVLLNDASLGIFDIVRIPGSNGYTSSIVPLMEAFSMYNIKTQYQYREDIVAEYDNILLDIINPLWDKIEDLLNAPLQTLAAMVPNLALFIGNDGLCQIIDNLLTPVSALIDAIKPVVNLNDLLTVLFKALNFDLGSILGKIGITNFKLDLYELNATLKQVLGADAIIPLINNVLGLIKIKGQPLGLKLNDVDWLQLASHGKTIVAASQVATYGSRIFVEGDSAETLIAVLRYLIITINTGDNYKTISNLIAGLLGDNVSDSISGVIDKVLGMLQGDTDEVIASLVELLQMLA